MRELAKWSEHWCVGNLDIDRQRKHLFRLWQMALDVLEDEVIEKRRVREYLNDILAFMRHCFAAEEELLARTNCYFLQRHAAEHAVLGQKLTSIIYPTACELDELHKVLLDWTNRHVPEIDVLCCGCSKDIHNNRVCKQASERKSYF